MNRRSQKLALSAIALIYLFTSTHFAWASTDSGYSQLYLDNDAEQAIKPDAIKQGQTGDCYFLAALASLAQINPGAIQEMIQDNKNGTYTVTFPGAPYEPITVNSPTKVELDKYAKRSFRGIWPAVMEKAYGVYCSRSIFRRTIFKPVSDDTPQENISGSYFHTGIRILTGGGVSTDWTTFTSYKTMMTELSESMAENKIITIDTSAIPNSEDLPTKHEYSVLDFRANEDEPKLSVLTIRNPWGYKEPEDSSGNARDGYNDGIFKMTLEEVNDIFHSIAIGDKALPITEIKKPEPAAVAVKPPPPMVVEDWSPKTTVRDDGTRVTTQKYRPTIYEHSDGTVVRKYGDGSVATDQSDGTFHLVSADGREYWEKPDGTRIWHNTDGSKETVKPDKTNIIIRPDGSVVTHYPNGTKTHEYTDDNGKNVKNTVKADGTSVFEEVGDSKTSISKADAVEPATFKQLVEEVKAGNLNCTMLGDGETTTHCTLVLKNHTDAIEHVKIPSYECFVPSDSSYQVMMSTEEKVVDVPANGKLSVSLPTICASTKSQRPPTTQGREYLPKAPEGHYLTLKSIIEASSILANNGDYSNTPIPKAKQKETFSQLAVWMENAKNAEDKISPITIKKDICSKAGLNMKSLGKSQKRALDSSIKEIFKAADLTRKEGHKLAEKEV